MKKIFVVFLFISSICYSQRYNDFAELLFSRCTIEPTAQDKAWISEAFDSLQYYNLIQKIDFLHIYAASTEQVAYLNWVNDIFNGTESGAQLTFAADTGIKSDGSASYLNTNYNPKTDSVHATMQKSSFGAYIRNEAQLNGYDLGVGVTGISTMMKMLSTDNTTRFSLNSASATGQSYTNNANRTGLLSASKIDDGYIRLYGDGVNVRSIANVNSGIADGDFFVCAVDFLGTPTNYSPKQFSMAYYGTALTTPEHLKLFEIVERYLDHKSVGVR